VGLQKVLEVMSTSVYTGLKPFNFIRKHFLQICVQKVAVRLQKLLEVMSTSVYTGLNPFNFIRKHFL
jgi:hydrogenase maturation factor